MLSLGLATAGSGLKAAAHAGREQGFDTDCGEPAGSCRGPVDASATIPHRPATKRHRCRGDPRATIHRSCSAAALRPRPRGCRARRPAGCLRELGPAAYGGAGRTLRGGLQPLSAGRPLAEDRRRATAATGSSRCRRTWPPPMAKRRDQILPRIRRRLQRPDRIRFRIHFHVPRSISRILLPVRTSSVPCSPSPSSQTK